MVRRVDNQVDSRKHVVDHVNRSGGNDRIAPQNKSKGNDHLIRL